MTRPEDPEDLPVWLKVFLFIALVAAWLLVGLSIIKIWPNIKIWPKWFS